ncbi:MAG: hypothetical protein ACYTEG_00210 [Planctomycetota bacterium]
MDRVEWNAHHRAGSAREEARRNVGIPRKPSKSYVIPCDEEVFKKVWEADKVRQNAGTGQGISGGIGDAFHQLASGEPFARGKKGEAKKWSKQQVVKLIRWIDNDLWVRINAWAGNWRRGIETAGRHRTSPFVKPTTNRGPLKVDFKRSFTLPNVRITGLTPDCHGDNLAVTSGEEHQLRRDYGSYLPKEGAECGGEDQVRCKKRSCRLEHIWAIQGEAGGNLPVDVHTDRGVKNEYINTAGGFGVYFNPNPDGSQTTQMKDADEYGESLGEHEMQVCIFAFFRCVPKPMVVHPPTMIPRHPSLPNPDEPLPPPR